MTATSPYHIGDKVRMRSPLTKRPRKKVWTVIKVRRYANSGSGWILDVAIDPCPHCKRSEHYATGYDSDWFVEAK